jgi:hypothetical protein
MGCRSADLQRLNFLLLLLLLLLLLQHLASSIRRGT